jgi:hypothetical protein
LPEHSFLSRAGQWFLRSGIQESNGGVARYYVSDLQRNRAVSTEITGYAVSTLLWLRNEDAASPYLERALGAARFLTGAWTGSAMPFETGLHAETGFTYFFDCGIIVRGLLAAWRTTSDAVFREAAVALGSAMAEDFGAPGGGYHPILTLPEKAPLERDPARWSRMPGCYQLKAALAWWELSEATSETAWRALYDQVLDASLQSHPAFLPGHPDRTKVVDRLHAYLYFLEGLLPRANEKRCAAALCQGIQRVSEFLEQTAEEFERSDVYAQLLRVRLFADWAQAVPLNRAAAERESAALAGFQVSSADPRIDGGFYFGRQAGTPMPYVNPVSTAFAAQALALWQLFQSGGPQAPISQLI